MAAATDSSIFPVICSLGTQLLPEPFQPLSPACRLPSPSTVQKGKETDTEPGKQEDKIYTAWREDSQDKLGNDQNEPGVYVIKNLGTTNTFFIDTSIQKMLWIQWLGHNIWLCTYKQALTEARCCIGKKRMQDMKKTQLMDENWWFLPQGLWEFRITLIEATEKRIPSYIPQALQLNWPCRICQQWWKITVCRNIQRGKPTFGLPRSLYSQQGSLSCWCPFAELLRVCETHL